MSKARRFLSTLLVLCFVLGMVPGTAFAAGSDLPFTDVKATDWFYEAVQYAYENGIMKGTSTTTFSPDYTTDRGMIVTVLHRMEGTPSASGALFSDVAAGKYYADAVAWASANGIVYGYGNDNFGPEDPITREQMATILYRYAEHKGYDTDVVGSLSTFSDASKVSSFAVESMAWAVGSGLITGIGNNLLDPQGSATRSQMATILMRFCNEVVPSNEPGNNESKDETYTVTFNLNYGSNGEYSSQVVKAGEKANEPSAPSRSGYTFNGWYTKTTGGTKFDFGTEITSDITLYAHWSLSSSGGSGGGGSSGGGGGYIPPTYYTVTFYMNDGTSAVHTTTTVAAGNSVSAPAQPTRSGYSFDGWYTDAATTTAYSFETAVTENLSLYAKWTGDVPVGDSYTVTFESNGGTIVAPISVAKGATVSAPTAPTKDNHVFAGWYTTTDLDEMFLFDDDIIIGDTTLYADWIYNDEDAILAAYAVSQITIGFQSGDSSSHVTRNVSLPTNAEGADGVSISWSSGLPGTVSSTGMVSRPADSDQTVTLTATASRGNALEKRDFVLNVIHTNERDHSTIPNHSVIDLQNMNQGNEDFDVSYNDDKTQVTSIEGRYTDIVVENADDALDAIQGVHTILGIDDPYSELEFSNMTSDEYGAEYTFEQYYNGYEVYGRTVTVSAGDDGVADSLGSGFCATVNLRTVALAPSISQAQAEENAIAQYGPGCDADTPETHLVIYSLNGYEKSPALAYYTVVSGTSIDGDSVNLTVFVNATTGEVIVAVPRFANDSQKTGSGKNEFGTKVSFPVNFTLTDWFFFYMYDSSLNVQMYSQALGIDFRVGSEFNSWRDGQVISAYTNMRSVVQWWKDTFNRNSLDNRGMKVNVVAHAAPYTDNAYWDSDDQNINICDTAGQIAKYSRAVATDVLTHESTHAVIQYDIGRAFSNYYQDAPGAINEGYADIFGCINNNNWTHGESLYTSESRRNGITITCTRNIADPDDTHALSQGPDRLSSPLYVQPGNPSDANDYGGVHINSLLVSHAAYLMNQYGMSMQTLGKLWYKSLSMHYDATSDFHTVRQNVLKAAKKIHLSDSEIAIIKRAFDEEEIYGDSGTLAGVVCDTDNNWVTNASVTVSKNGIPVGTYSVDSLGGYSITLEEGTYVVTITADGFVSMTATVSITENEMTSLNATLVRAGNGTITGTVVSATTALPLDSVLISVRSGFNALSGDVIATTSTDANGYYSIDLPSGYYTFELSCANYTPGQINVAVEGNTSKSANGSLSPIMSSDTYRIVLTWGTSPRDLDSHLVGTASDGKSFHIYYADRIALKYDGTEIGNLDVDDTDGEGPETITFKAETTGTYTYYVYRYSSSGSMPASRANVKVYNGDNLIGDYDIDPSASSSYRYWTIFRIENGIFRTVNSVGSSVSLYGNTSMFDLSPDVSEPEKTKETGISAPEDNPDTEREDSREGHDEEGDATMESDTEECPDEVSGTIDDVIVPDETDNVSIIDVDGESDSDTQQ